MTTEMTCRMRVYGERNILSRKRKENRYLWMDVFETEPETGGSNREEGGGRKRKIREKIQARQSIMRMLGEGSYENLI